MKYQHSFLIVLLLVVAGFAKQTLADELSFPRAPNIQNPQDVRIGSRTSHETNDLKRTFLRFSAPADLDVRIEGIGKWYPDPEAVLWEIEGSQIRKVKYDDDSGDNRDFLITHRLKANLTYVLQVGTRVGSLTTVDISTSQIVVHGEQDSHSLQGKMTRSNVLWGFSGEDFEVPEFRFGLINPHMWDLGSDFGNCNPWLGVVTREFAIQEFTNFSESFEIEDVSVSDKVSPFSSRSELLPEGHFECFEARPIGNDRIAVTFLPLARGLIEANLMIKYSIGGVGFTAQMPLRGRVEMNDVVKDVDASNSMTVVSGFSRRNFGPDPSWLSLDFKAPVDSVTVYVFARNRDQPVNASFYADGIVSQTGQHLRSNLSGFAFQSFSMWGQTTAHLKLQVPTEQPFAYSAYDVWIFPNFR